MFWFIYPYICALAWVETMLEIEEEEKEDEQYCEFDRPMGKVISLHSER